MQKLNAYPSIPLQISIIVLLSLVSFLTCIPRHIQAQTILTTTKINETYKFVRQWGSEGSDNSQFEGPLGIAVDSHGNVYVTDSGNQRIQVFAPVNLSQTSSNKSSTYEYNSNNTNTQPHAGISGQF